jgi:hypothetical protein
LIVEEANDIGTAWLRIDLLPASVQPVMRELFRKYLDSRLETYRKIPDLAAVKAEQDRTAQLQNEIWKVAMAGQKEVGQAVVTGLLPALNQMFDIVTTRTMALQTHPPGIVFAMLALMAGAAAFMAGHGMSGSKAQLVSQPASPSPHHHCFVILTWNTRGWLYPRGFLRPVVDLRQSMK